MKSTEYCLPVVDPLDDLWETVILTGKINF